MSLTHFSLNDTDFSAHIKNRDVKMTQLKAYAARYSYACNNKVSRPYTKNKSR